MTLRRLILVAAVAALAVGLAVPARAAAPDAVGWWWLAQSAPAPVPSPPTVPEGGLYVAGDPSGPQAVSALRFAIPDGALVSTLMLGVADVKGPVDVGACPATAGWTPAEGGAWTSRPSYDCAAGAVRGTLATDGLSLTFDVSGLPSGPALDLVVVPGKDAVTGLNATFQLALKPPDGTTLALQQPADTGGTAVAPSPPADVTLDGGVSGDGAFLAATPSLAEALPGASETRAVSEVALDRTAPAVAPLRPEPRLGVGDGRGFRGLMAVVFVVLGVAYARMSTRPPPVPVLLGRLGARSDRAAGTPSSERLAMARGIGRFARPRRGPAPRL